MSASSSFPPLPFDNSYARLPERFFAALAPTPVSAPELIALNEALADELGLDPAWLGSSDGVSMLAGNSVPDGATPLAMAYAGFQFGNWVPQLGDGRAILLGEVIDRAGRRRDIQLKGSGPTPFSRGGDGRSALGPVLREYIVSEAMSRLGVPTTRALACVATGDDVMRESALPGAVLTRVASSHIRVGTFQYFAARGDEEGLRLLADHVIERHHPACAEAEAPYLALLQAVLDRQAELIAVWQSIGFIHGVMNTDNTTVSGETIDYGPCAFMDTYRAQTVYSSIDRGGRYAFGNQPGIAQWNLASFAQALLPLLGPDEEAAVEAGNAVLRSFPDRFVAAYLERMRAKLGLGLGLEEEGDAELYQGLLDRMEEGGADFTNTFRALAELVDEESDAGRALADRGAAPAGFDEWLGRWRGRLRREERPASEHVARMRSANPAYIPRNHRVEEAIVAAVERRDFGPFHALVGVLERPFEEQPGAEALALPPRPEEIVHQTFCGT